MPLELFIAFRYLLARRRQAFISLISLISMLGVAVGVMALIVVLGLMTGLQGELRDRLLGAAAHVYVWKTGGMEDYRAEVARMQQVPGVAGAGPAILGKALIVTNAAQTFITLKGVDPALEPDVTDIRKTLKQGTVEALVPATEEDLPGILIGEQLASQHDLKVGDDVSLITPQGTLSPSGMMPRSRPARVVGIYGLGILEFDSEWGFVSLEFAQRLTGETGPQMIQVRADDIYDAPGVAERIVSQLGTGYVAQDWQELNSSLFSALWLEKVGMGIAIGLIVLVAALQIIASLILLVMEKSRDIAILKTMGTSARRISAIFMMQGLIIGAVGTTVGSIAGLGVCWVLDHYQLIRISMDVYQIAYVPFVVLPREFVLVVVSAIVICFVSTIYPSRQAARLDPVQALRFE